MNNDNLPLDLALMDPELRELLLPIKAQCSQLRRAIMEKFRCTINFDLSDARRSHR
jgi:hypothetical protein